MINTLGTRTDKKRNGILIQEMQAGGYIISEGSMNWNCSLACNDYQNKVARVAANVIQRFVGEVTSYLGST